MALASAARQRAVSTVTGAESIPLGFFVPPPVTESFEERASRRPARALFRSPGRLTEQTLHQEVVPQVVPLVPETSVETRMPAELAPPPDARQTNDIQIGADAPPLLQTVENEAPEVDPRKSVKAIVLDISRESVALQCNLPDEEVRISLPRDSVPEELQRYGTTVKLVLETTGVYRNIRILQDDEVVTPPLSEKEREVDAWIDSL